MTQYIYLLLSYGKYGPLEKCKSVTVQQNYVAVKLLTINILQDYKRKKKFEQPYSQQ